MYTSNKVKKIKLPLQVLLICFILVITSTTGCLEDEAEKEVVIEMLQFFYDNGWINDSSQLYFNSLVEKTLNGGIK